MLCYFMLREPKKISWLQLRVYFNQKNLKSKKDIMYYIVKYYKITLFNRLGGNYYDKF